MKKAVFCICLLLGVSIILTAQSEIKTDSTSQLNEIFITATRKNTAKGNQPYSTETILTQDLETFQPRTTPEALFGLPGVFIQKTNHGGGSPIIRGLTGNQTLMIIDGIRLNNSTYRYGPNQYFNTVDLYCISKIEVVRGSGSVQYGSDAMGGVIQVFSKEPKFKNNHKFETLLIGKVVSQDMEYTGRCEVEFQSKNLGILVGYTNRKFGDLIGGDTSGVQTPSGYSENAFDAKIKLKLSNHAILTFSNQFINQNKVPLYHKIKLENFEYYYFDPQQRNLTYAKFEFESQNKLINKLCFTGSYHQNSEKRKYHKIGNSAAFSENDHIKTIGLTFDMYSIFRSNWSGNTGIEFYHDKVKSQKIKNEILTNSSNLQRGLYPDNAISSNFSAYHLQHLNYKKFSVEGGFRYQLFSIGIPDTTTNLYKLGNVNLSDAFFVSNLGALYKFDPVHSIYLAFSTGFRAPNIDDMGTLGLVDFRYEIPASNLKSEKSYNTEFGYKIYSKKINTSFAVFYTQLSDLITRVKLPDQQVGGYNVYTKENSQESVLYGLEASIELKLNAQLSLKGGLNYIHGQNISNHEPMRRIPPLNGRVIAQYQSKYWEFCAESIFTGAQHRLAQGDIDDNRISDGGTAGWNTLNLYIGYIAKHYALRFNLHNFLNRDYRTHGSGINGPGRNASISINLKI